MRGGIRLFRVLGITVSIDYTWFIVFFLFAWSLAYGYFPQKVPELSGTSYLVMGGVASLFLFICVLIHEIAHSYTANRLGLDVKEITLFIFGGVAQLTKEPDTPGKEFKIAIAGPLASGVLAALFYLLRLVVDEVYPGGTMQGLSAVVGFLATINIVLIVFNMIPGFPLDGGRVMRAIWWAKTGSIKDATRAASVVGKGFATLLIVFGFLQIISGLFIQGLWAVLIGVFLQQAAEGSYRQLIMKMTLEGMKVADIMTRNVVTVPAHIPISTVVERFFFNYHFVSFPVLKNGRLVGLLTLNDVRKVDKERWHTTLVEEAMERISPHRVLHPEDSVLHALMKMIEDGVGRYPVVDRRGNLVGILSRRDIMKTMEFKAELAEKEK